MCFLWVLLQMTMSSIQAKATLQYLMALSRRPCVTEAKVNQSSCTQTAVFCTFSGLTGIWWYPFCRSTLEKTAQLTSLEAKSRMLGRGYMYVRLCYKVKLVKVAAGMPAAVHLLHNGPGKGGPLYDPVLHQLIEFSLHRHQLFAIKPSKLGGDGRPWSDNVV